MTKLELLAAATGARVIATDMAILGQQRGRVDLLADRAVLVRMLVGDIGHRLGAALHRLGGLVGLFLALDAHVQQRAGDFHLHQVQQLREQLEGFALVFLLGVLLGVAAQVDALAQVVQRRKVFAPALVDALQQHHAHERVELLDANPVQLGLEQLIASLDHRVDDVLVADGILGLDQLSQRNADLPLALQHLLQARQVPLLLQALRRNEGAHDIRQRGFAQRRDLGDQRLGLQDVVALLVDDLALVIRHIVVLQQLLADVEVAGLDLALRALNGTRDDACLDGLALGHLQAVHDGAHPLASEDAHQLVVQRQIEAAGARVALAAGTAAQLVVDAAALVALGRDDAQAALGLDLVVQALPLVLELLDAARLFVGRDGLVGLDELDLLLDIAAQHDVGAATGHVGGDGDHTRSAGLGDDLRLLLVLLGVEHVVRQLLRRQQLGDVFRILDGGGAHEHRLPALVAVLDVRDDRVVLLEIGLVDQVELVLADGRAVRRDDDRLEAVDLLELVGLGVGRARHAGQLAVHAEVVLEGDGGQRLVLGLDLHALLGLDGLVQAIAPTPPAHQPAGELVDDDHLAVLHDVVLVPVVDMVGPQRCIQVMHQRDVGCVVEARPFSDQARLAEQALGVLVALFREMDLMRLLVHREVARLDDAFAGARVEFADLLFQVRDDGVDLQIDVRVVVGLARDDQRRARLVDQDGVHLVDDGVGQSALHTVGRLVDHVVAQIVEAVLVVGAVGHVGRIGGLLLLAGHLRQVDAHRQAQEVVQLAHPLGVAPREVVVHRDDMDALARQRVQVDRQRRHQGLAFAGAHLGHFAGIEHHAANQLHIEVAHLERPLAALAADRKRLGQDVVHAGATSDALLEGSRLGAQFVVGQSLVLRLQRIDLLHGAAVLLEQALVAATENRGEKLGQHAAKSELASTGGWAEHANLRA
mmetsp:Transcript_12872/g.30273  ORF Transcript_12872/g.30273 Transcript_12872/m.30273 type:complete len:931 (-) Transcript_12872:212-3004(-)